MPPNIRKVGLAWRENMLENQAITTDKPYQIADFYQLLTNPQFRFYNFIPDSAAIDSAGLQPFINDLSPQLYNLYECASYLKSLDLLITVDSVYAHLAGALGVRTIYLLGTMPEFYWHDGNNIFYPQSLQIISQHKLGDRQSILNEIYNVLNEMVTQSQNL